MRFGIALAGILSLMAWSGAASAQGAQGTCPDPHTLGVARTVEIDTTGGPGFGFEHYKAYDFLRLRAGQIGFDERFL